MIKKKNETISIDSARNIVLQAQLLYKHKPAKNKVEAAAAIIEHLGYVQIDTIAVVQRAHQHVFWSRDERYSPEVLDSLQKGGRVFEYWTHAMSYAPMSDYRYYLPRMKNFQSARNKWFIDRDAKSRHLSDYVLQRITEEGALGAKDFENTREAKSTGWWDWKPAKDALEFLFWQGKLMIAQRKNFQKLYDLPERIIPPAIDTSFPNGMETALFIARRALRSLGLFTRKDANKYLHPEGSCDSDMRACSQADMDRAYDIILENGEAVQVFIEGDNENRYFINPKLLANLGKKSKSKEVHLLSPFDNTVIKRERLKRLFGFDYTIECYVPAAKRVYGYFVLPVTYGNNFVGRIDAKADRKSKTLLLQSIHFENGYNKDAELIDALSLKLQTFAKFNQCEEVKIINAVKDIPIDDMVKKLQG